MPTTEQPAFDPNLYGATRKNIRQRRKAQRVTSAQLAQMVGLSHDFIRQIQSGKAGPLKIQARRPPQRQVRSGVFHFKNPRSIGVSCLRAPVWVKIRVKEIGHNLCQSSRRSVCQKFPISVSSRYFCSSALGKTAVKVTVPSA